MLLKHLLKLPVYRVMKGDVDDDAAVNRARVYLLRYRTGPLIQQSLRWIMYMCTNIIRHVHDRWQAENSAEKVAY